MARLRVKDNKEGCCVKSTVWTVWQNIGLYKPERLNTECIQSFNLSDGIVDPLAGIIPSDSVIGSIL